ncbi:MAG: hypothetical protein MUP16_10280 [Sedimentisphaerales bacterium]|nr:hypothetical protein [Sedimentisphaerales bacterium]
MTVNGNLEGLGLGVIVYRMTAAFAGSGIDKETASQYNSQINDGFFAWLMKRKFAVFVFGIRYCAAVHWRLKGIFSKGI